MGNTNTDFITSLVAVSRDNYIKQLTDNVFNNFALFNMIKDKGMVTILDGGTNIQVPIQISGNTNVDSVTYYTDLQTDPQKGFINATVSKGYYGTAFPISDIEVSENMAESKVVDLLGGRIAQSEDSLFNRVNGDLFKDGTGNGGLDLTGLLALAPASATPGTYMGVSGATNALWTHKYKEGATATCVDALDLGYYLVADGRDKPDLILTGPTGLAAYEKTMRAAGIPLMQNAKLGDAGYAASAYKTIPMVLDQSAAGTSAAGGEGTYGTFWLLNSKYLGLYFKSHGFDAPVRAEKKFADIYKMLNEIQLVCSRRNRQAKVVLTS